MAGKLFGGWGEMHHVPLCLPQALCRQRGGARISRSTKAACRWQFSKSLRASLHLHRAWISCYHNIVPIMTVGCINTACINGIPSQAKLYFRSWYNPAGGRRNRALLDCPGPGLAFS